MMKMTKRELLQKSLFGAGFMGLRSLATGIPAAFLASPARALAQAATCSSAAAAQYLILCTSGGGDPVNANVPGTYDIPAIVHANDPSMAKTAIKLGSQTVNGAKIWSTLPQGVLDRTCFFHHATFTNSHGNEQKVLRLMGETLRSEGMASIFSKYLQGCLNTIQVEPLSVGAGDVLTYQGRGLPNLSPTSLKDVLSRPGGLLGNLGTYRDQSMDEIYTALKANGTNAQKKYLDEVAISRGQARDIGATLLNNLSTITSDREAGQITAITTLIQMNVAPVYAMHIGFGGDNHTDPNLLQSEVPQHISGVGFLGQLMGALQAANLQNKVTFALLNVFGRTLSSQGMVGRTHWANHHAGIIIGSKVKGGVVGGLEPLNGDFGATSINSQSGASVARGGGDISFNDSLGAYAKTVGAALGVPSSVLDPSITQGKVVTGALV